MVTLLSLVDSGLELGLLLPRPGLSVRLLSHLALKRGHPLPGVHLTQVCGGEPLSSNLMACLGMCACSVPAFPFMYSALGQPSFPLSPPFSRFCSAVPLQCCFSLFIQRDRRLRHLSTGTLLPRFENYPGMSMPPSHSWAEPAGGRVGVEKALSQESGETGAVSGSR